MALGNWDYIAWDEEGKQSNGRLYSSVSGVEVDVYKNWLYIKDKEAWKPETNIEPFKRGGFIFSTIGQVPDYDGQTSINYKDIHIRSVKEDSTFWFAVWLNSGRGMIGVATYAYDGEDYVGVREWERADLKRNLIHIYNDIPLKLLQVDVYDNNESTNQGMEYILDKLANNPKE